MMIVFQRGIEKFGKIIYNKKKGGIMQKIEIAWISGGGGVVEASQEKGLH